MEYHKDLKILPLTVPSPIKKERGGGLKFILTCPDFTGYCVRLVIQHSRIWKMEFLGFQKMDVMSLEHNFGKEIETSLHQLFNYFCNNINLGQWQAAKACLKQLELNKNNFKFDLNSVLIDIIENPEFYCHGSLTLESPYHLSLLLYEYCTENNYLDLTNRDEKFYDKILLKFTIHSTLLNQIETESDKLLPKSSSQLIVDELVDLIRSELTNERKNIFLSIESPNNASSASLTSVSTLKSIHSDNPEISPNLIEYLKNLLINQPLKAKFLFEMIFKYNIQMEHVFLKVHLDALSKVLESLEVNKNRRKSVSNSDLNENIFHTLLNQLSIYKLVTNKTQLRFKQDKTDSRSSNLKYESLALVQRCFKDICYKFNSLWSRDLEELEENFRNVYASLLFDFKEDEPVNDPEQDSSTETNLLQLFSKIHYEIDRQITISSTFNDETLLILSLIKQHSSFQNKEFYLWRRFFLYCFMENRVLLKTIIDECLLLITKHQFDNLSLIFSVKEFLNLKPLILLIGISKVNDLQSAKRLIASLCTNNDKGTLIEKIGSLLKTHLDFIAWFQQIKAENRKKEVSFNELIKLLQKQLPLNIISQFIDITSLDYLEMTKMLRNTLTDKANGHKTKWVRFVDEVNEKISQIQETCLATFNGFFCLNEILNSILYCCENLNRKLYTNNLDSNDSESSILKLKIDYSKNVIEKLENVKKILHQITPLNYRLEVLENIYSLIYLSCSDLKEPEDEETEDDCSDQDLGPDEPESNETSNNNDGFEILTQKPSKPGEEVEFSIYEIPANNTRSEALTDRSSKSTLGSYHSYSSNNSRRYRQQSYGNGTNDDEDDCTKQRKGKLFLYRRNAGGGGSFLVNDFMCRDLLLLLKEALQVYASSKSNSQEIGIRATKLQQLVNETLWRFQIVKCDKVLIEYGQITNLVFENEIVNEKQQNLVYELMRKRKRRNSSASNVSGFNESGRQDQFVSLSINKSINKCSIITSSVECSLALNNNNNNNKSRATTLNSAGLNFGISTSYVSKEQRKSLESHRSLSLIYPLNKNKRSNLTIMKLLSDIETLSALCLKDSKFSEANQIVKMYSTKKDTSKSFEFRQIIFNSIFKQTFEDLAKLSFKQEKESSLVEKSLQSLDMAKITETLLSFEKDDELLQSIFLCDLLSISKVNIPLSASLLDYAGVKLNQHLAKLNNQTELKKSSSRESLSSEASNEKIKLECEIRSKLSVFIDSAKFICSHFDSNESKKFINFLTNFDGVQISLNGSSNTQNLVEKYENFIKLKSSLNELKTKFENLLNQNDINDHIQEEHDLYFSLMSHINDSIKLTENDDVISSFFYKPVKLRPRGNSVSHSMTNIQDKNELFATSIENLIYKSGLQSSEINQSLTSSISLTNGKSSNYLLSFYEYSKTLYEYFKEKSSSNNTSSSYFSLLNFSPASLICKLLFEDGIKPQLIESLTQKLNLNLTAIILHNSCPRLKLTLSSKHPLLASFNSEASRTVLPQILVESPDLCDLKHAHNLSSSDENHDFNNKTVRHSIPSSDVAVYNLASFYTILNESDIFCCSLKKPDKFLRDLMLKLLNYCRLFMTTKANRDESRENNMASSPTNRTSQSQQFLDLKIAQEIYQCAEFKTILNESQELQHLNLYFLKTDHQKLSFFINLYNLLCIHSNFYLASINNLSTTPKLNDSSANLTNPEDKSTLFRNKTEKLLFQQRMCYKVGQMGCISLYDLKHHILLKKCLSNDQFPNSNFSLNSFQSPSTTPTGTHTTITKSIFNKISSVKSNQGGQHQHQRSHQIQAQKQADHETQLFKYAFYTLDLDAEPLWSQFLPSESVCDYRVLFALTNCTESDPPICVYNSDKLLDDQLQMQMKLFLNESIHADLCQDVLYLPNFLIENCSFFIDNQSKLSSKLIPAMSESNSTKNDLESLVRFLIEQVNQGLSDNLKGLLDLDSIHGFGENIDQYGRKELPFPIIKLNESKKFCLVVDSSYNGERPTSLWYKREINRILQINELNRIKKISGRKNSENLDLSSSNNNNNSADSDTQFNLDLEEKIIENQELTINATLKCEDLKMDELNPSQVQLRQQLNKDCLEYIQKSSPLISNSLAFLFDVQKRTDFFKLLTETNLSNNIEQDQFNNSLNRFIQLYVPLDYMKHLSMQTKLNLVTQFLLTNKTEESKIELIIDLANYYTQKQEWNLVLSLLNNCTQDNEELNDLSELNFIINNGNTHSFDANSVGQTYQKNLLVFDEENLSTRFSQKDLYNLYDHACICLAYQESKKNEKSYTHLFKMKNFLRQIRAIFGLLHLWPIDGCLELIDFCLTKSRLFEQPNGPPSLEKRLSIPDVSETLSNIDQYIDCHNHLISILNNKKMEFTAYKELTNCARMTLEKYYKLQQIQDAAGFYDSNNPLGFSSTNEIDVTFNLSDLNKMKKICQKCLMWQFAKSQLESVSHSDDEETKELIMDLFLLNDQFTSAKYLIRKLSLGAKLQSKLDFGHLKHRLLNLNASSSIIVIDLDSILKECISFANEQNSYVFGICFKLLNDFKDLNELNNQVLVSLSEFLINNFKSLLTDQQLKEFKILQLTAKIFQIILQNNLIMFDSYKRHHSQPLLIIEQLLMNSHIDLCSKTIKMCRESLNDTNLNVEIKKLLVKYAHKALEFKVYKKSSQQKLQFQNPIPNELDTGLPNNNRSPVQTNSKQSLNTKKRFGSSAPIESSSSMPSSPIPTSILSTSFKTIQKFAPNPSSSTPPGSNALSNFVMPNQPPCKEDWIKDEHVNDCMVCNTSKFSLLNRRHHCRRCGRVVCSNCSQRSTLIENISRRTCDDCFRQLEVQKVSERARLSDLDQPVADLNIFGSLRSKNQLKSNKTDQIDNNTDTTDENTHFYLMGGTSDKQDDEIRSSFRYNQAPSTSLCLSILDLHDNPLECGTSLLNMCDDLSSYLQTANQQIEDFGLIINMIKHLLHNAKVKLLQNSTNIIPLCDTYLSLIDVLEQLLLANCSIIPSFNDLRNTESAKRIRSRLLEEERHELAMNLSTKCGLDTQTVWASWGLIELRCGNYKEARTKFDKCLRTVTDKHSAISVAQLKNLNDIVNYMEVAPPVKIMGPQTLLAPLRSVETLIAEPQLFSNGESNMDDLQFKETIYYLETYGTYTLIVSFYQRNGKLEKAFQYLLDKKCNSEVFVESLLVPCLKTGEFYNLLEYMLGLERSQNKLYQYYSSIGKYLEKNGYLNTLYDFQILMKDYVRACMNYISFFTRHSTNYSDLFNNLHYLYKARQHLEQYLEVCTTNQFSLTPHNQQFTWKQKPEQQNLRKQITTQEVDNYLNAINLQIEVTKFINNCAQSKKEQIINKKTPTLFASNDMKINLCCLILLSGQSIQEGFGFVIRIIQCFNLKPNLVYSQIACELAKQYNFKEISNLLKCINESGYKDEINASYDECISTCIRVFAALPASTVSSAQQQGQSVNIYANQLQQQHETQLNKEIEDLIKLIKNDENRINAYILNGRLKSAYLIAIKINRPDLVRHISNVAERIGLNLVKDICVKWLEKNTQSE